MCYCGSAFALCIEGFQMLASCLSLQFPVAKFLRKLIG